MIQQEIFYDHKDGTGPLQARLMIDFDRIAPENAADAFLDLLSSDARVLYGGDIIRETFFNVQPNTAINRAVARGLVHKTMEELPDHLTSQTNIAVIAVENSAPYLAFACAEELERILGLPNIPIDRIRKGNSPSALLYPGRIQTVEIHPITATDGLPRYLHAEMPEIQSADYAFIVDDVRATVSSLDGAETLARQMYPSAVIVRCTVFEKTEQRNGRASLSDCFDTNLITIDHFGWNEAKGHAILEVAHHAPRILYRATAQDFVKKK